MDISADLTELGRTPISVVCAGVKSILDIPRTLEYLETQGVGVISVGTTRFPAFFTPDSGYDSPASVNTATEGAAIIKANSVLGLQSGMIFAVPVPKEESADIAEISQAIEQALAEMKREGVSGKNSTPFLLKRVAELTSGKSLAANIALVKSNARYGSSMAVELAKLNKN
jgi:pseudouridine-5'-phosphate glycosidase